MLPIRRARQARTVRQQGERLRVGLCVSLLSGVGVDASDGAKTHAAESERASFPFSSSLLALLASLFPLPHCIHSTGGWTIPALASISPSPFLSRS